MRRLVVFAATVLMTTILQGAWASTWYVDASVSVSGDGTSPGAAFKTVQEGIDAASGGDTVIVASGVYVENIAFDGTDIVLRSTDPLDSTVVAATVIDGNEAGSVVTFAGGEDASCVLSGFTIRNGNATSGGGIRGGAWPWTAHTHATIQNNVISNNTAGSEGGGLLYCDGAVRNNVIFGNSAGSYGGGLSDCDGTILNNTIVQNTAGSDGSLHGCGGSLSNCIIWGNHGSTGSSAFTTPTYSCIESWTGGGTGNIFFNPHFVDPQNGDFHLESWSPAIDAGDPGSSFSTEPAPNGARVNMGAYGNTPEATSASSDTDTDDLPDDWEMHWFLSLAGDDSADPDTDLIPNIVEYRYAWDPTASAATLAKNLTKNIGYQTIQAALLESDGGDEIVVYAGIYYENIAFGGKNVLLRSTDPLDEAVVADTVIDGNNAGPVVSFSGSENATCALSGFTIRNGAATQGGGICGGSLGNAAKPTIQYNAITGNSATSQGGCIYSCKDTIFSNIIAGNSAKYSGAISTCNAKIRNNAIIGNSAEMFGGGIYDCGGEISSNTIVANSATSVSAAGGGLNLCDGTILNCIIWGNTAATDPQMYSSSAPTYSCIQDWTSGGSGNTSSDPSFAGDPADAGNWTAEAVFHQDTYQTTLVDTGASWQSDALIGRMVNPDTNQNLQFLIASNSGNSINVWGDVTQFVDSADAYEIYDYRLLPDSPCIDVGKNESWMSGSVDLDGNPRIRWAVSSLIVDMGSYEAREATPPVITLAGNNPVTLAVGSAYVEPGYTAADNYDGDITADVAVTGTVDHMTVGNYTLHYNVSDSNGNPAEEKTRTVNVVDTIPPVITLSGANPVGLVVGNPYSEPGYTATDNYDGNITADVVVTGSVDHMTAGSYTLYYNVTDSSDNPAQQKTRTVNVVLSPPPVITLLGDNPLPLELGTPFVEPGYTAADDIDGDITADVVVTGSVDRNTVGSYTLHYNVSNSHGIPAEQKARTVNVVDTTSPLITLLGDNPFTLELGTAYVEPGYTATDNYDGDVTADVEVTGSINNAVLGSYTLHYNVSDSSANPAVEKTRTIHVVESTPPVITLLGDNPLTLGLGTAYSEPGYTAGDNYDGDVTADVVVTGSVDHAIVGSYLLHYNVTDSSGNPAEEKTRTVTVVDTTSPTIVLLGDNPFIVEAGTPYEDPGFAATDNYDGDITEDVVITGVIDHMYVASYALKYNVQDSSGNPAVEKIRVVEVVDTTPPLITLDGDNPLTLERGTPYVEPGYTATDACDGDMTADVNVTGSVNHTVVGSYTIRYNVSDWSGNPAEEKTRTVNVVETAPPVIILSGDNPLTLEVGTAYVEPGYTATDDHDGDLTAEVAVTGTVDHTTVGVYTLHYNVSNSSGNPAEEKTRTVNVVDTTPPVISLSGDNPLTLEVGTAYVEPGFAATDNYDGDLTAEVGITGTVDHMTVGVYTLHYNVSDSSGNPAQEKTRTVNVVDTTPPEISLSGDDPLTLEVGTAYVEPGYTATDNYDGDLTAEVEVSGTVDHTRVGVYTLHYNISDSSGNPAEERTRTVNVIDATPPEISLSGDDPLTLEVGTAYVEPGYIATDNYDGDLTAEVEVTGTVDHTTVGVYTLHYNVSDSSGNPAEEKTRTVNVVETAPPVISLSGNNPLTLEVGMPYVEPGYTATDDYDGDLTAEVEVTGTVDHTTVGVYTLHYDVSDSSGNPAEEKTRTVNVVETAPPVISLSGDNPLALEVGMPYVEPGYTATDDYDGDLTAEVEVTGTVDHTTAGVYALHYNVSDSSGNPAEEKTRTVEVVEPTTSYEIVQIAELSDGVLQLTWSSEPGATYVVSSCSDLSGGVWMEETTVTAQGEITAWTDNDCGDCVSKFYRVARR